jgi:site-specific DNA-methyltransferase (cytosine-N4-specific)
VDSYTNVWWLAKTDRPKADNRKVLRPYSAAMKRLLQSKRYNAGKRPSAHDIDAKSFLNDNKGSVTHNFLDLSQPDDPSVRIPNVLRIANTSSNDYFSRTCRKRDLIPHPARMPVGLAAFFIEFLTAPGDLVLDPFGGSNTTGFAAELLRRRWVTFEIQPSYAEQSLIRLSDPELKGGMKHGSAPAHP